MAFGAFEFTMFSGPVPADGTTTVGEPLELRHKHALVVEGNLARTSGGTTIDVYVQTSVDGGNNWVDVMNLHFTTSSLRKVGTVRYSLTGGGVITPTDGALGANTVNDGVIGTWVRHKTVVSGSYVGTLSIKGVALQ